MTRLRAMPEYESLWERRTTFVDRDGVEYHLLCIPDLVQAKKTQRSRDWPVFELLVTIHYREHADAAHDERVNFWLREARTPELLTELCQRFPTQATALAAWRPLIRFAQQRSLAEVPLTVLSFRSLGETAVSIRPCSKRPSKTLRAWNASGRKSGTGADFRNPRAA